MLGVMSLSTAPSGFKPSREYLMLHTLAFACVKKFLPHTELVTDELGLIIADRMRWDYTSFRLDLHHADKALSEIWSSGKLYAQLAQNEPYCHVDNDFILHNHLPGDVASAPVFAQSKDEPDFYLAPWAQAAMRAAGIHPATVAYNTGIVGGQDVASLHAYCQRALDAMRKLAAHQDPHGISILAEQAAFGEFFRSKRIKVTEMIPLAASAVEADFRGREFTHLWGHTKRNAVLLERAEARLARHHPQEYQNFINGFERLEGALLRRGFDTKYGRQRIEPANPYTYYGYTCYSSGGDLEAVGESSLPLTREPKADVAVVLICHPGYLKYLPDAMASIEDQGFKEKVLVYDKAGTDSNLDEVYHGSLKGWVHIDLGEGGPNKARNEGLAATSAPWVCFWDADNVMPPGYLRGALAGLENAPLNVGVFYPEVQRITNGVPGHVFPCPEWSLDNAQRYSLVDTSSFWRAEALKSIHGWSPKQVDHDDYELALRLFRAGWRGKKLGERMLHNTHGQNRSSHDVTKADKERTLESLWTAWTYAVVTLWSGNNLEASNSLLHWIIQEQFPPQTSLFWVDDSGGKMTAILNSVATYLRNIGKFKAITIINSGDAYDTNSGKDYFERARHDRVATLYNLVFARIHEEMIVTVEDDMLPPTGGLRKLVSLMRPANEVAVATGVYRSRHAPEHTNLAYRSDIWFDVPKLQDLPKEPFKVGMTGGGFAVIANWALRQCMPMRCNVTKDGYLMGWDGNLGLDLGRLGLRLLGHPEVFAHHRCPEVIAWEQAHPTKS